MDEEKGEKRMDRERCVKGMKNCIALCARLCV